MLTPTNKIQDTNFLPVAKNGRLDQHWRKHPMKDFATKGKTDLKAVPDPMAEAYKFGLKGFEFGNWTTNEDRANFMATAHRSLPTFAHLIGFKAGQVGLSFHVGIAYGARGHGRALAHYEPGTGMINLTRYPDGEQKDFFRAGGMESFAHEWGHALDYFLGTYIDQHSGSRALTFGNKVIGSATSWKPYEQMQFAEGSYRFIVREILATILFSKRGKTWSPYMAKLIKNVNEGIYMGDYWLRFNEIFARTFEQYVSYKAKGKKLKNSFLTKPKYSRVENGKSVNSWNPYLNPELLKKVAPLFDQLLAKAAKEISVPKT